MTVEIRAFTPRLSETAGELAARVEPYLPVGYHLATPASPSGDGPVLVLGWPHAGWTMDRYVLPRLASGLILPSDTSHDRLARFVDEFVVGYLETREWVTAEGDEWPSPDLDADAEALGEVRGDCVGFVIDNLDDLHATGASGRDLGGEFYLTRNRHGSGYWDRGYGHIGRRLTDAAHPYGTLP